MRGEDEIQNLLLSELEEGDVMLDIGANFGLHSLLAGRIVGAGGEVHAFEPLPANLERLRHHLHINHLGRVVQVVPSAVSDSPDATLGFFSGAEELGATASLSGARGNTQVHRVANTRLDDYASRITRKVKLVKIDVEGAELSVLMGGMNFIGKHKPILVIEVHAFAFADFGTSLDEFKAFLNGLGYTEEILPESVLQDGLHYQAVYRAVPAA
jgi:FkbM family methyltransferase